jgi:hypothetical protein
VKYNYYAIHFPGKYADVDIGGVLRRGYNETGWVADEVWGKTEWEWSPIFLAQDHGGDMAFRFSVITEGEAENIIARLTK